MIPTSLLVLVICLFHVNYAADNFENFAEDKLEEFIALSEANKSQVSHFKRFKSFVKTIKSSNNDVQKKMKSLSKLISKKDLKKKLEKSDKMLKKIKSDVDKLLTSAKTSTTKIDTAIEWIDKRMDKSPPELRPVNERLNKAKEYLNDFTSKLEPFSSSLSDLAEQKEIKQEELDNIVKPMVTLLKDKNLVVLTTKALNNIDNLIKNNKK